jgi:hypothetical protein
MRLRIWLVIDDIESGYREEDYVEEFDGEFKDEAS